MKIPPKLKEYINNNRGSLPPITDPDEPLQLDSLGLIRLVAFLESDLGIRVEDEELMAENFATLRTLEELLATKTPTAIGEVKRPLEKRSESAARTKAMFLENPAREASCAI
jgi:acyl carrier protein